MNPLKRTLVVCEGCECLFVDTVVMDDLACDGGAHTLPFVMCDSSEDHDAARGRVTTESMAFVRDACGEHAWEAAVTDFEDRIVPADCRRIEAHRTLRELREL